MIRATPTSRSTVDVFCSRCNILVEAEVHAASAVTSLTDLVEEMTDEVNGRTHYEIAMCKRCEGPFLIETQVVHVPGEFSVITSERVLYPVDRTSSVEGVPATVQRIHEQAVRSFNAGLAEPCAIMCRKTIEAICAELGATGRTLHDKLANLRSSDRIDSRLLDWADSLRIIGNDAAHDLSLTLTQADARDALEFVEAILLYVFTLQARFEAFRARRTRADAG